jgi:hypothetical protein
VVSLKHSGDFPETFISQGDRPLSQKINLQLRSPRQLQPDYCYHITVRCNNRDFRLQTDESKILDFGFWILDFGFWILDWGWAIERVGGRIEANSV